MLLSAKYVIPVTSEPLADTAVLVRDGRIADIGDADKMRASFEIAWTQAEAMLASVRWEEYGDVLFIGKSIGTIVASRYAHEKGLAVRSILLTPLKETFAFVRGEAVAFHGTADPWANTDAIIAACRERGILLHLTEDANHSLETGDVLRDIRTLETTMAKVDAFIGSRGGQLR